MPSKLLNQAKKNKYDEFYTQLTDIENELKYYKDHFKGKVIYCNCDDPADSNFYKYFAMQFGFLGLKKLITTHYDYNEQKLTYKLELTSDNFKNPKKTSLKGNGDFRSAECIEILKEADIVVTNPPFSLFRDYVAQLIEHNKKFIIIGNLNAIGYREIFPYFKENKIWLGCSIKSGGVKFYVPHYKLYSATAVKKENKEKIVEVAGVRWFTNLDHNLRHEPLILYKTYNEQDYPTYVNYDAINVDKTKDIPKDYDGVMGVPISFMMKYNPNQFEIIALGVGTSCEFTNNYKMEILKKGIGTGKYTRNGKAVLYIKYNKNRDKYPVFKDCNNNNLYTAPYVRILIKKK